MATPTEQQPKAVYVQGELAASYPRHAPEAERGTPLPVTVAGDPILHRPLKAVTKERFGTAELAKLV
ncbi:MAG: peptide deformylase, partial [Actinocrinis sp.]